MLRSAHGKKPIELTIWIVYWRMSYFGMTENYFAAGSHVSNILKIGVRSNVYVPDDVDRRVVAALLPRSGDYSTVKRCVLHNDSDARISRATQRTANSMNFSKSRQGKVQ